MLLNDNYEVKFVDHYFIPDSYCNKTISAIFPEMAWPPIGTERDWPRKIGSWSDQHRWRSLWFWNPRFWEWKPGLNFLVCKLRHTHWPEREGTTLRAIRSNWPWTLLSNVSIFCSLQEICAMFAQLSNKLENMQALVEWSRLFHKLTYAEYPAIKVSNTYPSSRETPEVRSSQVRYGAVAQNWLLWANCYLLYYIEDTSLLHTFEPTF